MGLPLMNNGLDWPNALRRNVHEHVDPLTLNWPAIYDEQAGVAQCWSDDTLNGPIVLPKGLNGPMGLQVAAD